MKSSASFQEQVDMVSHLFSEWNDCERVVALYSLLRRLGPTQVKFINQVIGQMLPTISNEIVPLEQQANDPANIKSLVHESKDSAVMQLLRCLPLLFAGNTAAKAEYLNIIPQIIDHSISNQCHLLECRQLLCYTHLHPAISAEERSRLSPWMSVLDDMLAGNVRRKLVGQQAGQSDATLQQARSDLLSSGEFSDYTYDGGIIGDSLSGHTPLSARSSYNEGTMPSRDSGIADIDRRLSTGGVTLGSLTSGREPRPLTSVSSFGLSDTRPAMLQGHPQLTYTTSEPGVDASSRCTFPGSIGSRSNGHQKLTRTSAVNPARQNLINPAPALNPSPLVPSQLPGRGGLAPQAPQADRISPFIPGGRIDSSVAEWVNRHHAPLTASVSVGGEVRHLLTVEGGSREHLPLSPQSSVTSSGSGGSDGEMSSRRGKRGKSVDCKREGEDPEMRDIMIWLKALRLHKYSNLFQNITYDDMMSLTETWLEEQGVTKGARDKMLISINKLHGRQEQLRKLETEVLTGNVKPALSELKRIVYSPIKAFTPPGQSTAFPASNPLDSTPASEITPTPSSESTPTGASRAFNVGGENCDSADKGGQSGDATQRKGTQQEYPPSTGEGDSIAEGDLPGQITRIMGKICTQLLVSIRSDTESLNSYIHLLDRCTAHQAFPREQKKKMMTWRPQIQRLLQFTYQKQHNNFHPSYYDRQRIGFTVSPPGTTGSLPPSGQQHIAAHRALRGAGPQLSSPAAAGGGTGGHPTWTFMGKPPQNPSANAQLLAPEAAASIQQASSLPRAQPQLQQADLLSPYMYQSRPLSLEVNALKQPLGRTQSAPMRSDQQFSLTLLNQQQPPGGAVGGGGMYGSVGGGGEEEGGETATSPSGEDIHVRLSSLCMSMMEHAMGSS